MFKKIGIKLILILLTFLLLDLNCKAHEIEINHSVICQTVYAQEN